MRLVLERAAAVILPLEGRGDWEVQVEEGRCWGRSGGDARSRSTAMVAAAGGVPVMGFGLWLYFRRLWHYFPVCGLWTVFQISATASLDIDFLFVYSIQ